MDLLKHKLLVEQTDKKLAVFKPLVSVTTPSEGWIHTVRTTLNMSLRQLAVRLKMTPQSVKEIEQREANGSITIKSLKEVGAALDLRFVYGFIPKHNSIDEMIEQRATEIARDIVRRTSKTMQLEDQENSSERLEKAVKNRAEEIKRIMPKYLWD